MSTADRHEYAPTGHRDRSCLLPPLSLIRHGLKFEAYPPTAYNTSL